MSDNGERWDIGECLICGVPSAARLTLELRTLGKPPPHEFCSMHMHIINRFVHALQDLWEEMGERKITVKGAIMAGVVADLVREEPDAGDEIPE